MAKAPDAQRKIIAAMKGKKRARHASIEALIRYLKLGDMPPKVFINAAFDLSNFRLIKHKGGGATLVRNQKKK